MEDASFKVLLVEDNPGDARLVQEFLAEDTTARYDITHVARLDEGLELAREDFDFVLLDLNLPDEQGLDVVMLMGALAADKPIVILTGQEEIETALGAIKEGAQDYLLKSELNTALLARSVRYAIEWHRLQYELQSIQDLLLDVEKERVLAQAAGTAARKFDKPLQVITRWSEALADRTSDQLIRNGLAEIEKAANRMNDIVADISPVGEPAAKDSKLGKMIADLARAED